MPKTPKTIEFTPIQWDAMMVTDEHGENPAILLGMDDERGTTQLLVHFELKDFLRFAEQVCECADNAITARDKGLEPVDVVLLGPGVVG